MSGAPASRAAEVQEGDPAQSEEERSRAELLRLLMETGGNVARVARRLGMPRSTVRYKIRRYALTRYIPKD